MRYVYESESNETLVMVDGDEKGVIDGEINRWRNGIPHPKTNQFDDFEDILRQMSTPDERSLLLHIIAGNVERIEQS